MTTPEIVVYSGELIEGETIELMVSHPTDVLFFKHPRKLFSAYVEKNLQETNITNFPNALFAHENRYYYEEGFGDDYVSIDEDFLQVKNLSPGRLFAIFEYEDIYGEVHIISQDFPVRPKSSVKPFGETTTGNTETLSFESTLKNVHATWLFNDNGGVQTGNPISRQFDIDGYHTFELQLDYSDATYDDGDVVVWDTAPSGQVSNTVIPAQYRGGVISMSAAYPIDKEVTDHFEVEYLAKKNLDDLMDLNVQVNTANFDGDTNAPMIVTVNDNSTYDIGFDTDPDSIETVEIDFGDGEKVVLFEVGFNFTKVYKRSGLYTGRYTVNTKHITNDDRIYRNKKEFEFSIKVEPFFSKWLRDNVNKRFYNSAAWYDLSEAWGTQADRLYNEIQGLIDSLDIENIDDRFLKELAKTYGDFIEIYERVGFTAFIDGKEDPFKYLNDYNIFERIDAGTMTPLEKQEFVNYIQTSRNRLQLKGTPKSIEDAISQFNMSSEIKELYTDNFEGAVNQPLTDDVFAGDKTIPATGITHTGVSAPVADNADQIIVNADDTPYIEINTVEQKTVSYYTNSNELRKIDGLEYIVFPIEPEEE